jgi:hypothetical protein
MSYLELDERQRGLTRSQTLNSVFVAAAAVGMMFLGLLSRNSALSATILFEDEESGIRASIPAGWLINQEDASVILTAQDPGATPFKTFLSIRLLPVGEEATPRNVVDTLTLQRSSTLSTYRVLSLDPFVLGEDEALEMNYAYVQADRNPFLNTVPLVVQGRDVVVIRGGQAVVITYREERSRFEANAYLFDNFLATLEF